MLNREKALEELRDLYMKKDFGSLRRKYYMLSHFLTDEDKRKILPFVEGNSDLVRKVIDKLGGTIV